MITATQFLTKTAETAPQVSPHLQIELTFDQREKSRLRATSTCGAEIGISLRPGTIMKHGDVLALSDGRNAQIVAAQEKVMEASAPSARKLAAIAYHIGNRHVPMEVGEGVLRLLPDHVLRAMIEGLGGSVVETTARFTPESGAYGHSHVHHSHDDMGHGGRIHEGLQPRVSQANDIR
jgi:urease accessory protein